MKADAIIFDKDGTLLDFDAFWVQVSVCAIEEVLARFNCENVEIDEILASLGVHNGITDIEGVLCKGTYAQMGELIYDIMRRHGCEASGGEVAEAVQEAFSNNADNGEILPTCPNLAEVLLSLKKRNKKLAVVTTDNEQITRKCLKKLGVEELFDRIYTDDGRTPTKPDPYCAFDFCESMGVAAECTVMVGDTMTDVTFAKNAGISVIAVAKTEGNGAVLSPFANYVVSEISDILDIIE